MTRVFPLGLISATLGICAAGGVPVFDAITKVPGFVQGPIMLTGVVTGVLAVGSGIGAVFVPQERTRGIIGIILGAAAIIMLPSLMRA